MKKVIFAIIELCVVCMLSSTAVFAMNVNGPNGSQSSGWYKDSFNVFIQHGSTTCVGSGTAFSYNYVGNQPGSHHYAFYGDVNDNPYLTIDNGSYMPLDMKCPPPPTSAAPSMTLIKEFDAAVDTQPPYVNITSPNGSATTSANSYTISGPAGDMESGVQAVQTTINGEPGPAANLNGNTFSVIIPLASGNNTIQAIAYDKVGHSATSNTVTITSGQTSGGGGPTTGGGSTAGSGTTTGGSGTTTGTTSGSGVNNNGSTSSISSAPTTSTISPVTTSTGPVKFGTQQVLSISDPYANDAASNPADVQASAALAGATGKAYYALIIVIVILVALCGFVIWRFRPIFADLDRDKSGLRRRIVLIVTLPSLIPLIGLGFLGYQQLSNSVKNSLSGQLEKAAQTSSIKLGREFGIRRTVITKTASDILQIKSQYQDQHSKLANQASDCQAVVKLNIPKHNFGAVTSNDSCLPFLTGFAQLASSSSAGLNDYLSALNDGAAQADKDLSAQEQQRLNELLGSVRDFFPDVTELAVVGADSHATVQAALPRADSRHPSLAQAHADLLRQAASDNLALLDMSGTSRELLLTYPIINGKTTLGGVVVALNLQEPHFIPAIWQATPKPYALDEVYFLTTSGDVITSPTSDQKLASQAKALAATPASQVYNLKLSKQVLASRTAVVTNSNWVVAVGAPANSILAPLAGIQLTALLAIGGFMLLSVLLGIWFVSSIASEIERLFRGALAFAKGDLGYRISLKSHDELQVLSETMNQMAGDIKQAQEALVEKDKEFISIATHELKAPMTAIMGNLSMIKDDGMGQVDDTARRLINQAYDGTVRLRDMVTDMLDIARLESGHADFKLEPMDIGDVATSVLEMQAVPAQQAGIQIKHEPSGAPKVLADKNKLQIILTNFVSNAIKYNRPNGSITVSHVVDGDAVVTSVADTGLGIPVDQQAHIFEKFYRVQHADRAKVPGTGLGMHITKRFIENMGGKVWFTSVHGQGTTFFFSLPIDHTPTVAPATVTTPQILPPAPAAPVPVG